MSKIRASATKEARSEGGSMSRRNLGFKSPIRRYDNFRAEGAEGAILTQAVGGFNPTEQFIAGRDTPLNAISIKSTVEMV